MSTPNLRSKLALLLVICFQFSISLKAQQSLQPLKSNVHLQALAKDSHNKNFHGQKTNQDDTVYVNLIQSKIIFQDDFSGYAGWPNPKLWADNEAFINNSFGFKTLSKGVATFDGFDRDGMPYNDLTPTGYGENDHLTSLPIELGKIDLNEPNIDSVYLSFYHQPQGMNPFETQPGDSLLLQFLSKPDSIWRTVWRVDGQPLFPFRKVTLLLDTKYYYNGFQFRFVNFGNQAGNVDHWHLDYVLMTSNKKIKHAEVDDMAFRYNIPTLLKDYTAMPHWHYNPTDMLTELDLDYFYFNNFKSKSPDVKSFLEVFDKTGASVFSYATNSPEYTLGFVGSKVIKLPFNASGTNVFPTATNADGDYFRYKISYEFNDNSTDSNLFNDVIVQSQVFGSYYSYDDGTAEAGYGVFGSGNKLAYLFDIGNVVDTLTAMDMFFTYVVQNRSAERFKLTVWLPDGVDGAPGTILYQKNTFDKPIYGTWNIYKGISNFTRYNFNSNTPIIVTGKFYVGYEKVTEERMNIGYDVNINSQKNIYVSVGDVWSKSDSSGGVVPGSLMMRPVFRIKKDPVIGIDNSEENDEKINLYPNPAKDMIYFDFNSFNFKSINVEIYGPSGKLELKSESVVNELSISGLNNGFYFIRIMAPSGAILDTRKIVVAR